MYHRILIALENSAFDQVVIPHVAKLAQQFNSQILLVHVADGWAARNFDQLKLAESAEMKHDREYLEGIAQGLRERGLAVEIELALGNPPTEIVRAAQAHDCDLIALTSHGHRLIGDLFLGSTIDKVRHTTAVPLLVVHG